MKTILTEPTHGEISIVELDEVTPITNQLFHVTQSRQGQPRCIAMTGEELTNVAKAWLKHAKEPGDELRQLECMRACDGMSDLVGEIGRMREVLRDAENIPQAIAELLYRMMAGRHCEHKLAVTIHGEPVELSPDASQQLAYSLYKALLVECGVTAKSERADAENQRLAEENAALKEKVAGAAALREALQAVKDDVFKEGKVLGRTQTLGDAALSTNAGRELLAEVERLRKEAKDLTSRLDKAVMNREQWETSWHKDTSALRAEVATLQRKLKAAEGMAEAAGRLLSQSYSVERYSSWIGMCEDNNEKDSRDEVATAIAAWNAAKQPTQ